MQKPQVLKLEILSSISKKGKEERVIGIPKDNQKELSKLEDKKYTFDISIRDLHKKLVSHLRIDAQKIATQGEQRFIFIPIPMHKEVANLKDKKYLIEIIIQEI